MQTFYENRSLFASCMKRRRMKTTCKGDVEEKAHGGRRWSTSHSFMWISALRIIILLQCSFAFVFCWNGVGTVMNSYSFASNARFTLAFCRNGVGTVMNSYRNG